MDLTQLSATTLCQKLQQGELQAQDVLEAHIEQYKRWNPHINALIAQDLDSAREQARHADEEYKQGRIKGPLHGLPITVKDIWDTHDLPTTHGIPWLKRHQPRQDAYLVQRLRDAGAIIWGKSSLPLSSYDWQCVHPTKGRCNNPWDLGSSPGGSSGGSAAVVAARIAPMELGSDVAGSIRFPAHSCGVYGLRSTEGLLDGTGHAKIPGLPPALRSHTSFGPMARHPEDLQLCLQAILDPTQHHERDVLHQESPPPLEQQRIAWTSTLGGMHPEKDTRDALASMVEALEKAGAHVEEIEPPFDFNDAYEIYGLTHGYEFRHALPWPLRSRLTGAFLRWVYNPIRLGRGAFTHYVGKGLTASSGQYFRALQRRDQLKRQWQRWCDRWDLWITPTAVTPALSHQRSGRALKVEGRTVSYCDVDGPYNCPTAALGHPVIAMPVAQHSNGRPIGLQLHGAHWRDGRLIQQAGQIAALLPTLPPPQLPET